MKKIAILIENVFDERELIYPYYRLLEEGFEVHLIGQKKDTIYKSKTGLTEKSTHGSDEISAKDYDAVVIPGGFSPDYMRRTKATVDFVRDMYEANKIVAAICHAGWVLASAFDLKGKKLTSYFSIKVNPYSTRVAIGNKIVGASRVGVNLYGVVGNARREISCSFDTALCIENHLVVGNEDGNLVEVVGEIVVENLVER